MNIKIYIYNNILMSEKFIQKAKQIHGDKYNYSKVEYIKAIKKVIIICKEHGEFLQQPSNHLQGNECAKCSILKRNDKSRYNTEIFIIKAKQIHGEQYNYSKVNYIDSKTKIVIVCKEHGEYLQAPTKHLQKQGCPKCMSYENSNNKEFIEKAIQIYGDKYDYSKVKYINSQTKVIIICKKHGEFLQIPNSHLQYYGCKECGYEVSSKKMSSNTDFFIQQAKQIHGDKYDYSKVEYIKAIKKVIIICKEHGEFKQTPPTHLNSMYSCPDCVVSKKKEKKINKYKDVFIEKAKQIHGDKYDYSKSNYISSEKKIIIICKEHGEFKQQPNNHLQGKGCIACGINNFINSRRSNIDNFLQKAIKYHGDLYDYSKVNYINSNKKVVIICKNHGDFEQTPCGHLSGKGCKLCGNERSTKSKYSNSNEFIEKSIKIHGDLYDYSKVNYIKSIEKVVINCKIHGDFKIRPNNHINCKQGCPKCQLKKQYSKKCISWLNFISKYYNIIIQHGDNDGEYRIPNTRYSADGYCIKTNTIYEFNGTRWHGDPRFCNKNDFLHGITYGELYEKTIKKENTIKNMGFNYIKIWEYDWDKINKSIKILQRQYRYLKYKYIINKNEY